MMACLSVQANEPNSYAATGVLRKRTAETEFFTLLGYSEPVFLAEFLVALVTASNFRNPHDFLRDRTYVSFAESNQGPTKPYEASDYSKEVALPSESPSYWLSRRPRRSPNLF